MKRILAALFLLVLLSPAFALLQNNQFIGFGAVTASGGTSAVALKDHKVTETAGTTWTVNTNLGTSGYNVVGVGWRAAGNITLTSATIDGAAATIILQADGDAGVNTSAAAIIIAASTGSATGNVVTNYSGGGMARAGIGVWNVTGISSATAYNTTSSSSDPATPTINVPDGGIVIGYAFSGLDGTTSTPNTLTEDFDEVTGAGASTHTGLSKAYSTGGSGLTVGNDFAATTTQEFVAASWSP